MLNPLSGTVSGTMVAGSDYQDPRLKLGLADGETLTARSRGSVTCPTWKDSCQQVGCGDQAFRTQQLVSRGWRIEGRGT